MTCSQCWEPTGWQPLLAEPCAGGVVQWLNSCVHSSRVIRVSRPHISFHFSKFSSFFLHFPSFSHFPCIFDLFSHVFRFHALLSAVLASGFILPASLSATGLVLLFLEHKKNKWHAQAQTGRRRRAEEEEGGHGRRQRELGHWGVGLEEEEEGGHGDSANSSLPSSGRRTSIRHIAEWMNTAKTERGFTSGLTAKVERPEDENKFNMTKEKSYNLMKNNPFTVKGVVLTRCIFKRVPRKEVALSTFARMPRTPRCSDGTVTVAHISISARNTSAWLHRDARSEVGRMSSTNREIVFRVPWRACEAVRLKCAFGVTVPPLPLPAALAAAPAQRCCPVHCSSCFEISCVFQIFQFFYFSFFLFQLFIYL